MVVSKHLTHFYTIRLKLHHHLNSLVAYLRSATFGRGKKGATKRAKNKKGTGKKGAEQKGLRAKSPQNKKGEEQKGREITMLRHRYIQGRNFFR